MRAKGKEYNMIRSSRIYRVFYDRLFFPVFLRIYFVWVGKIVSEHFRDERTNELILSVKILTRFILK